MAYESTKPNYGLQPQEKRIVFPLRVLDEGSNVADLHEALTFLHFEVAEREKKANRFGRTTRSAVLTFQGRQGLSASGQVDEATAQHLNAALTRRGFFPAKARPFRSRHLRLKLRAPELLEDESASYIRPRLNERLKEEILHQFRNPSKALEVAVNALDLDYSEVTEEPLHAVILDRVIPVLLEDPELEVEMDRLAERGFAPTSRPVSEMLALDYDLRHHPFFRDEARRARNVALAEMVSLAQEQLAAVEDLDLDEVGPETWNHFVAEGVFSEQQRSRLENVVQLARLTDDQFEVIAALHGEGHQEPASLISLDKADWLAFLQRHNLEPPAEDDLDTYARLLDLNVQQSYRTSYLLHRLVDREREDVLALTRDLGPLLERNERIFGNGRLAENLDFGDVDDDELARLRGSLRQLNHFANVYRHLGIPDILNSRQLSTAEKQEEIRRKQETLRTFREHNPDLDLEWVGFFPAASDVARAFQPDWTGLSREDQVPVRKTLMAFQRIEKLTGYYEETEALLANGLDSALAVLKVPEDQFAGYIGLPDDAAHHIYHRAADTALLSGHFLNVVEETTTHAHVLPAVLVGIESPDPELVNVLRDIDGYEDLFGNQNYCHCEHCRSIFSPAAYFVDLMEFIHDHVSGQTFVDSGETDHPLYLRNRRPDLWTLPLTCANTNTLIPYLNVVNQVLERYLETIFDEDDIYQALTTVHLSFNQPFNLPFAALQLYLSHFRVSLVDLYELFQLPAARVAAARLGCSPQEWSTIMTPRADGISLRYGVPPDELTTSFNVQNLMRHMNVSRDELERLLHLDFVKDDLMLAIRVESPGDDLVGFEETANFGTVPVGGILVLAILQMPRMLDRLHRFVRLWRKLPWTPEELHLVLTTIEGDNLISVADNTNVFLGSGLTPFGETLITLASLRDVQETFDLSVEELCALCDAIPTTSVQPGRPSLFSRMFDGAASLHIEHPALGNADPQNPTVSPDFGLLQGALRLSEAQILQLITAELPADVVQNGTLDHSHLSQLYRPARLARLLGINLQELAHLNTMAEMASDDILNLAHIPQLLAVVALKQAFDRFAFSVNEVWWLLTDESTGNIASQVVPAHVDSLLEELRAATDSYRFFTPDVLAEVEGVRPADAEALLNLMADDPLQWVERPEPTEARYRLTSAFALDPRLDILVPDMEVIVSFFVQASGADLVTEEIIAAAEEKAAAVRQRLQPYHPPSMLVALLTEQFNINQAYLAALQPFLTIDLNDEAFIDQLYAWLDPGNVAGTQMLLTFLLDIEQLLYLLQGKLDLPVTSLAFIAANPDLFALILPVGFTWENLQLLSTYSAFLPDDAQEQDALHQILLAWTGQTFPEGDLPLVAGLLESNVPQVESLLDNLQLPAAALDALSLLAEALRFAVKLGLDGAALRQLTAMDYSGLGAAQDLVYGAMRAKYDEQEWLETIEPFQDRLNMIKRDALVDRVLSAESQLGFEDTNEIYQFFLLDVEMDGCARISRVKEAISACQLYVHRCRMNLEQSAVDDVHVSPSSIPEAEWLWRKNYRVWEANRKVFLYPENWLAPDLRDDKTPIFRQVESDLLQSTITPEAIEKIYRNYLREYAEVAKLIVVSTLYDENEEAYLFFARTPEKPHQYYWRKLLRNVEWTPWVAIDIEIEPSRVSAHIHHGQLYLFWLRVLTNKNKDQGTAGKTFIEDNQTIYLEYSLLETGGKWSNPRRLPFHNINVISINSGVDGDFAVTPQIEVNPDDPGSSNFPALSKTRLRVTRHYDKVYVHTAPNDPRIRAFHFYSPDKQTVNARLDEWTNRLDEWTNPLDHQGNPFWTPNFPLSPSYIWGNVLKIHRPWTTPQAIILSLNSESSILGEVAYEGSLHQPTSHFRLLTSFFPRSLGARLEIVHYQTTLTTGQYGDLILTIDNQQFFIRRTGGKGYKRTVSSELEKLLAYRLRKRDTVRLSTTVVDRLGEVLFTRGLDQFLGLDTQKFTEEPIPGVDFTWIAELPPPVDTFNAFAPDYSHLNFKGAHGPYFRELFFHLPFLIAHYLNAAQKFADADHWYRRIFDPTASENPSPNPETDRNWRYVEFRNRQVPRLREILTDEDAIARYKEDPFNPFAIARLRILAFQKAVVMKYIDNLLDWGDHLFGQDTFESINEATMLYVMAADILGDRPFQVGDCETINEAALTYAAILDRQREGSEFLIELENLYPAISYLSLGALGLFLNGDGAGDGPPSNGFAALRAAGSQMRSYASLRTTVTPQQPAMLGLLSQRSIAAHASASTAVQRTLAFCVPPNETLLGYWDRVEDRLFKIRHCMNLQGVRRELALFQPPIDPGLLVKARAAGLSLEDVLGLLAAELPAYRFSYLLEKARQLAGTVQSFGGALLSALEKKDGEELTLLRAIHEQELLKQVRKAKVDAVTEANYTENSLIWAKAMATNRKNHVTSLLTAHVADAALAISEPELDGLDKQEDAKDNDDKAGKRDRGASGINAAPSIGFDFRTPSLMVPFNPLAEVPFKFGISPLVISYSTAHVASALSADAVKFRTRSGFRSTEANKLNTSAGYKWRKLERENEKSLAAMEETQLGEQILAAGIRIQLANKELATHNKQIEQAEELDAFYKDKFTGLGLYTHLAASLSRLYRQAYNLAHGMAMKAQSAYQFETDDQTFFIANDNWQADSAGLLAGERLLMQLQQMEAAYLEKNRREYELNLPCPLSQLDPQALLALREDGFCTFTIPEFWFDLHYPGQYKRRIKSVRLNIPAVTGPYTNVGAKLTLTGSRIRKEPQLGDQHLVANPAQRNTSIVTSSAVDDAGMFEFTFRDERYLPFEGAGADSDWTLELPSVFRPFDYDTISDAILQISYTAKDDGRFKVQVEDALDEFEQSLADQLAGQEFLRWFSLKRDFSTEMHLLRQEPHEAVIQLGPRHFPYLLHNHNLTISAATLVVKPRQGVPFNVDELDLQLNGLPGSGWVPFPGVSSGALNARNFEINQLLAAEGNPLTISVAQGDLSAIADIWALVSYQIEA